MAKRYILHCAVCDRLYDATRKDALTCSSRCRVQLHRRPPENFKRLSDMCRRVGEITPFMMLQLKALHTLRPDLRSRIPPSCVFDTSLLEEVAKAFDELVMEKLNAGSEREP